MSNNNQLRSLDTKGSTFTDVLIKNCPVETVKLEKPTKLILNKLYYLIPENFIINDYERLEQIDIDDIDFDVIDKNNSKNLSKMIIDNIIKY